MYKACIVPGDYKFYNYTAMKKLAVLFPATLIIKVLDTKFGVNSLIYDQCIISEIIGCYCWGCNTE